MMPKPAFNQNQPFQVVSGSPASGGKPAFDSTKAFEVAESPGQDAQTTPPSFLQSSIKSTVDNLPMIGGVIGGVMGTPADAIAGPMGNVAGAAVGGYVGTAAKNLINRYYDPSQAPKTDAEALTQPVTGGIQQAAMQAGGELATPLISGAARVVGQAGSGIAKWLGTKALSNAGRVSPAIIKEYSQYADRINSAPDEAALKHISDEFVGKLSSDVDAKKLSLDQAQQAFNGLQSDLKDAYRTAGYDARDAVTSAQQSLKDAHNARIQQLSGDVYDSVNQLKSDVQAGSGKALDTLNQSDSMVKLAPVYSQIDRTIADLNKAGTDEALGVAGKLQAYKDRLLTKNGQAVPALDAKSLIQGLDKITKYNPMAGTFDQAQNAAFKGIRATLDDTLKNSVPEYRAAMQPVAADADLLSRVQDFGDKQTSAGILQRINAPGQAERKAALTELGKKYGADFVSGAQPENLPEQQILQKAQALRGTLRPDRVSEKLDQTLAASRQKTALDQARSDYNAAQEKFAPFKPLAPNAAGQTSAQQKLAQLGSGNNIELTDMFQKLSKLTDTDFVQAMKDNNIKAAFQKGATNGSRNTVMGALAGYIFGGPSGIVTGIAAGRVIDQWGPAITKKVLDGVLRVSKSPTLATISGLNIPEPIKRNMVVALENYFSKNPGAEQSLAARSVAGQQSSPAQSRPPGYADGGPVIDPDKAKALQAGFFGALGGGKKPVQPQPKENDTQKTESFAYGGGPVPGRARVVGNSSKNDVVHAMLSPGEIVLPRSITQAKNAPEAAAKFVAKHLNGSKGPDAWAKRGLQNLGIEDQELASRLLKLPKAKELLAMASDLKPGTPAMNRIMDQIRKGLRKN